MINKGARDEMASFVCVLQSAEQGARRVHRVDTGFPEAGLGREGATVRPDPR